MMKFISMILCLGLFSATIPTIALVVSDTDEIGTIKHETCFSCGDCSVYCAIENEYTVVSSSHLPKQGANTYTASQLDDYNLQTAWVENKPDLGIGEWIEYRFDKTDFSQSDIEFTGIYLFNGYRKNKAAWQNNARIKQLRMIVNGKPVALLNLHDTYKYQEAAIPHLALKNIKSIRFEIVEAYQGQKFDDTALSELRFIGTHHH